jgi:hypothetical protein
MSQIQKFDITIFEVQGQQVNLTKMARYFGKEVKDWTRLEQSKNFVSAMSLIYPEEQIMSIRKGGNGEQGTFGNRQIALKLAQWISPEFEVFCIQKLDELFQTGTTELKKQSPLELLKFAVAELEAKEQEVLFLAKENTTLATRDIEVKTQREYKWVKKEIQSDRGRGINYYVNKYFLPQVPETFYNDDGIELTYSNGARYSLAHTLSKAVFKKDNYTLPNKAADMTMDQKKEYLEWLSRYNLASPCEIQ